MLYQELSQRELCINTVSATKDYGMTKCILIAHTQGGRCMYFGWSPCATRFFLFGAPILGAPPDFWEKCIENCYYKQFSIELSRSKFKKISKSGALPTEPPVYIIVLAICSFFSIPKKESYILPAILPSLRSPLIITLL